MVDDRDCPDWIPREETATGSINESDSCLHFDWSAPISACEIDGGDAAIGPYRLLRKIGEGGMGVVFLAEQSQPVARRVALKIIKPGMDSQRVIARFEAERQALELMDHPHIAKVFDAGATPSGRPYIVMELIPGLSITRYCDERRLRPIDRLTLFIDVCRAVQHAHQKGIIHRDLKPSNVIVTSYDDRPVPKVIDFGVAKATGETMTVQTKHTEFGQIVGTIEYMSPEQAELNQPDIDTRTDVYSLGVLLYELLTGTTPLEKQRIRDCVLVDILRAIREDDPPTPSSRLSTAEGLPAIAANRGVEPRRLGNLVRGDLDWIVMKALEKDRSRRYESPHALAADLQRFLADEPVDARPPSAVYRFGKFARRNKMALGASALIATSLVVGTVVSVRQAVRATQAEQLAGQRLEQERSARAEADSSAQQARQAVDEYFTLVSEDRLIDSPGLQPVRRQLLETALRYYHSLLNQRSDDPKLKADLIATRLRISQVYLQNDRFDDSIAALNEGLESLEGFVSESPNNREQLRGLAGLWKRRRSVSLFPVFPSDFDEATRIYQRAIQTWQELADESPDVIGFQSDLAAFHRMIGDMQVLDVARRGTAIESLTRSRDIWKRLSEANPESRNSWDGLADSLEGLGQALLLAARRQESYDAFVAGSQLREKMVVEYPQVSDYRAGLASCLSGMAVDLIELGRHDEAEAPARRALEEWQWLNRNFLGIPVYRQRLAELFRRLGEIYRVVGKSQDEAVAIQRSIDEWQRLIAEFPTNPSIREQIGQAYRRLAEIYKTAGRPHDVEFALRQRIDVYLKAAELAPDKEESNLSEAVEAQTVLLEMLWLEGRLKEAEQIAQERIIASRIWAATNTPGREVLGHSHRYLAFIRRDMGQIGDAIAALADAADIQSQLVSDDIRNRQKHHFHADTLRRRGELLFETNRLDEAQAALRQAVDIHERCVEVHRFDPWNITEWALSFVSFASLLESINQSEEAVNVYHRFQRAAGKLVKARPDRPVYQDHQHQADFYLAELLTRMGRPDEALPLYARLAQTTAESALSWQILGAARYRTGDWAGAIEALQSAAALSSSDGDAFSAFFLAMSSERLGRRNEARSAFEKGVAARNVKQSPVIELRCLRVETAALLGIDSESIGESR